VARSGGSSPGGDNPYTEPTCTGEWQNDEKYCPRFGGRRLSPSFSAGRRGGWRSAERHLTRHWHVGDAEMGGTGRYVTATPSGGGPGDLDGRPSGCGRVCYQRSVMMNWRREGSDSTQRRRTRPGLLLALGAIAGTRPSAWPGDCHRTTVVLRGVRRSGMTRDCPAHLGSTRAVPTGINVWVTRYIGGLRRLRSTAGKPRTASRLGTRLPLHDHDKDSRPTGPKDILEVVDSIRGSVCCVSDKYGSRGAAYSAYMREKGGDILGDGRTQDPRRYRG